MASKENKIQQETLITLQQHGVFCWRQNNNAIFDPKLNGYRTHNGLKGVPDILAVVKGQLIGFEIKTKTGKQSPDQLLFQRRLERNGGKYYVIKSKEDLKKAMVDLCITQS